MAMRNAIKTRSSSLLLYTVYWMAERIACRLITLDIPYHTTDQDIISRSVVDNRLTGWLVESGLAHYKYIIMSTSQRLLGRLGMQSIEKRSGHKRE